MLSFLKVKCPHCGAEGHLVAPPAGAIVVGECPKCAEMVVLFCGEVLPLEKARMTPGSEEARRHLMDVIARRLWGRIKQDFAEKAAGEPPGASSPPGNAPHFMSDGPPSPEPGAHAPRSERPRPEAPRAEKRRPAPEGGRFKGRGPITREEMEHYTRVELDLLDDKEFFKATFG